ncbi:MAG: 1,4-dihydroxy-2-naphthoate polyprenyltransferase, partial [Dermatophilaceae bacterium]
DIPTDAEHDKRTLAVRLGDRRTRWLYDGLIGSSVAALLAMGAIEPWAWLGALSLPLAWRGLRVVGAGTTGRGLVPVLAATGGYEIAYAALVALGVLLSA